MPAKKEVAKAPSGQVPAELMDELYQDQGAGGDDVTSDDMTIPFIKMAQALSEEVNKRESTYIPGLEQGDLFNSATQEFWKGEEGFLFVPVYYQRKYLEWIPRSAGGGFAGEHGPEVVGQCRQDGPALYLENGNEVVVTGTWYGLVVDPATGTTQQVVIALSKSQLKKSKQLMTKLKSIALARPDGKGSFNPPFFYNTVRMTSAPESNDQGSWYGWNAKIEGNVLSLPNGPSLYAEAKMLLAAIKAGTVREATEAAGPPVTDDVPF